MDSRKNKIFLAVVIILGAIILMMFVVNRFNVVKKVEKFVDDDSEEGEEGYEEEDDDKETFEETKPSPETKAPSPTKPVEVKPTPEEKPSPSLKSKEEDVKPINDLSTKFKNLIDEMDKQLKNKAVSDDIKKKVMTELMGTIETFNKVGDNTSSLISTIIQKYVPKQDNFVDAPVTKSMDTIKKYLKDALAEIESMESKNNQAQTSSFNERFVPSRDIKVSKERYTDINKEDIIEGFENTPHYALY